MKKQAVQCNTPHILVVYRKVLNNTSKPFEEDSKPNFKNIIDTPTFNLNGPPHGMTFCNIM